jgi:heat-inducible transcriptional repressor
MVKLISTRKCRVLRVKNMLNERNRKVLNAVVQSYIRKADPVGSRFVTKSYAFNLSSATIRNVMADLEDMGFLMQPHTSAGRIPTDKGYRFYVDEMKKLRAMALAAEIRKTLSAKVEYLRDDLNRLLEQVALTFADISNCLVFAMPLRPHNTTLNRIQLFQYKGNRTVAVLLTNEGLVTNRILGSDFGLTQRELNRICDYINSEFSGHTMMDIIMTIEDQISKEREIYDILVTRANHICKEALTFPDCDIIFSGVSELLALPEFTNRIDAVYRAIEDKRKIVGLLDELTFADGVQVVIGSENSNKDLQDMSIVAAEYKQGDRALGTVGMIGPTRMDYSRTIPMVRAMANYVSSLIMN